VKNLHDIRTEYAAKPLIPEEMCQDPVAQFTSWFEDVEKLNIQDSNAATLSTYDIHHNRVRSRIILIKEITKSGIIFFSNYESDKGKEIFSHPQVALNIYWPTLFRQVRFEGTITKTHPGISDNYFLSRPRASQVSAIISKQSSIVESRLTLEKRYQILLQDDKPLKRPEYWGGFEVTATYWEFWQGRNHRLHDRVSYTQNAHNTWEKKILEP
jgi:pyridoxamine 5'-phosphate oxidase